MTDRFPATRISLVLAASKDSESQARDAQAVLYRIYWQPIYGHVRRLGHSAEDAEDLTQGFVTRLTATAESSRLPGEPGEFGHFSLSPDGTTVALSRLDPKSGSSLRLLDLARGTNMRITFDRRTATASVWSPDGQWIALSAQDGGSASPHKVRANGSGDEQTLLVSPGWNIPDCWSPDGRLIVFTARDREGKSALWWLPMTGDRKPQLLLRTPFQIAQAKLSPDGRWLAYLSDESGRDEVYVQVSSWGSRKVADLRK